jgi:hypothetical protein
MSHFVFHWSPLRTELVTNFYCIVCLTLMKEAVPELRRLMAVFQQGQHGFQPRSGHVWFVVDVVALGQVFSEYFGFPCQFSFHRLLHTHHHPSSGAGTVGQMEPVLTYINKLRTELNQTLSDIKFCVISLRYIIIVTASVV